MPKEPILIDREGVITFHDACLRIMEEGIPLDFRERDIWERKFKKDVFLRVVQTLNRLGWKCIIPPELVKQYSRRFALGYRHCTKGNLKADLSVSGRCIELEMFQNVNAPDRPDNGGKYQYDKEKHMPYLMRLEMERTRRKIRTYLCNVFTCYRFKAERPDGRNNKCGPDGLTALEWIEGCYQTSWHFKGDLTKYIVSDYNRKSADGYPIRHKNRVWFIDKKGRVCTGIAYYNINNMWWVMTGKYDVRNIASFDILTSCPENPRRKRNEKLREQRLTQLIQSSVAKMDFEKAVVLRDILFPHGIPVKEISQNQ